MKKRADALAKTLQSMTIFIQQGELIVGNQASKPRSVPIFPEYAVQWIQEELKDFSSRPVDRFCIATDEAEELGQLCEYWKGKTLWDRGVALMPDEVRQVNEAGIVRAVGNLTSGDGHIAVNLPGLFEVGIQGYRDRVRVLRSGLSFYDPSDLKREIFYCSVETALEALASFIQRYAKLAASQAELEHNPSRKEELRLIGENCQQVSKEPPKTFWQALQLIYFIQLVLQIESNGHSVSFGRLDQYAFPWYARDMYAGVLSRSAALELLECLWVKLLSINKIRPWVQSRFNAGSPLYQNVTIGGQTQEGKDAVNDLTELILESVGELRIPQPNLSVRYFHGTTDDFLSKCLKVAKKGFGMPAFINDEIIVPSLVKVGVDPDDAVGYSAIGCVEVAVPGKWGYRSTGMSLLNVMRIFMATLRDGYDSPSGRIFCKGIGSLRDFETFDDVRTAWATQARYYARIAAITDAAADFALEENVPDILCSAFVDDCLNRGKTIKEGGAVYDMVSGLQIGIANLGNSLAAIRRLVFEDKRISKIELEQALASNFTGARGEQIRQMLLNRAPKYGNDDDYVDSLLRDAYVVLIEEIEKYQNTRHAKGPVGGIHFAGTSSVAANVPFGVDTPATPDGRKFGMPLAEGCSPASGTDRLGPTAVFKSVSKLPTLRITGGVLLNQKFSPQSVQSESEEKKLAAVLRAFFDDLKGWHVQYNVVSRDTLLKAKRHPEAYRDLVVRVAGYSAFFTGLAEETQDDIIARTEHEIG